MKINNIEVKNFGSYIGVNSFETQTNSEKNIIVFGGKNGAGKTTLFTAVTLCLYGCFSMGYKSNNSYYIKRVTKLINDNSKQKRDSIAYVRIKLTIPRGNDNIEYVLHREWISNNVVEEKFIVYKQGQKLNEEETSDFEIYIKNIFPPELFNLYFFDGEKIADYFMEDNSDQKVKNAFLTLCGYDVFEIMEKNFSRLCKGRGQTDIANIFYLAKDKYKKEETEYARLQKLKEKIEERITNCKSEIESLSKSFKTSGGKSETEWNGLIDLLRNEENKRTEWNQDMKKMANDTIPFIMVEDLLERVDSQIEYEREAQKNDNVCEVLNESALREKFREKYGSQAIKLLNDIQDYITEKNTGMKSDILNLSFNQIINVKSQIREFSHYNSDIVKKTKDRIKRSIKKSAKLRQELENSNMSILQNYLERKESLIEQKAKLYEDLRNTEVNIIIRGEELQKQKNNYEKARAALELELKNKSISDISSKAILMLDELKDILYHKEIQKVEKNFKQEINSLMYKMNFIDDIHIDDDFNIHVYRYDFITPSDAIKILDRRKIEEVEKLWGKAAIKMLRNVSGGNTVQEIVCGLEKIENTMMIPIELNKEKFSSGEKQIYIMALYYSIMAINTKEMPFIIDTPFARIDMEHRENISKYFFSKLKGQVFILSTDEEIDEKHMKLLNNKVATTYLLENTDNTRTVVEQNKYFEV